MIKPIIGITPDVQFSDVNRICSGKYYVTSAYTASVELAGGAPLVLPVVSDETVIKCHAELIDGLLLSGGGDVNPLLYGEEPCQDLGCVCVERDDYEYRLVSEVIRLGKPVFGICRGMQMLNVVCGGTLWQDIRYKNSNALKHRQECGSGSASHSVAVKKNTLIHSILGDKAVVNSFHHQCCKNIAPGFVISALSKDDVVEAVEKPGTQILYGVQWHPEHMAPNCRAMLDLFVRLIEAARDSNKISV